MFKNSKNKILCDRHEKIKSCMQTHALRLTLMTHISRCSQHFYSACINLSWKRATKVNSGGSVNFQIAYTSKQLNLQVSIKEPVGNHSGTEPTKSSRRTNFLNTARTWRYLLLCAAFNLSCNCLWTISWVFGGASRITADWGLPRKWP